MPGTVLVLLTAFVLAGSSAAAPARSGTSAAAAPVLALVAGARHTCAATTAGGLECWGWNGDGQLGDGTTTSRLAPVPVSALGGAAVALAAGAAHTCAVVTGGRLECWGLNALGELGDGTTTDRHTPTDVSTLGAGVIAVAANLGHGVTDDHTCAITSDGTAKCWGANSGQLGDGTQTMRLAPVNVLLATPAAAIATGDAHTCARTRAGGVKCWGSNYNGEVGDGTNVLARLTPVDVVGLGSNVLAVAAGLGHTCALTSAGAVSCWGVNGYGELGDGTTTNRPTPVSVQGLGSGVVAIDAGFYHSCALMSTGGVKCWGRWYDSNTTYRESHVPVDISGISDAVAIAAGYTHDCARLRTGGVTCWGSNQYGELGDGTTNSRSTPVVVAGLVKRLTVVEAGTGSGTVDSSPGGIGCPAACVYDFDPATTVALTASADPGSTFSGWSGDCSGTGACMLAMGAPRSVTATFQATQPGTVATLTVAKAGTGAGTVSSSPAGIACGATCSHSFASGTSVTLTATPQTGSSFAGWSGACSGTGACTIVMTAARTATATFTLTAGCVVPKVKGSAYAVAARTIRAAHCTVGRVTKARSANAYRNRVISQSPPAGTHLPLGGKVDLVIGKGTTRFLSVARSTGRARRAAAATVGRCTTAAANAAVARYRLGDAGVPRPAFKVLCGSFTGPGSATMVASLAGPGSTGMIDWVVFRWSAGGWRFVLKQHQAAQLAAAGSDIRETVQVFRRGDPRCCPSGGSKSRVWHWNGIRLVAGPWTR